MHNDLLQQYQGSILTAAEADAAAASMRRRRPVGPHVQYINLR